MADTVPMQPEWQKYYSDRNDIREMQKLAERFKQLQQPVPKLPGDPNRP